VSMCLCVMLGIDCLQVVLVEEETTSLVCLLFMFYVLGYVLFVALFAVCHFQFICRCRNNIKQQTNLIQVMIGSQSPSSCLREDRAALFFLDAFGSGYTNHRSQSKKTRKIFHLLAAGPQTSFYSCYVECMIQFSV